MVLLLMTFIFNPLALPKTPSLYPFWMLDFLKQNSQHRETSSGTQQFLEAVPKEQARQGAHK